MAQWKGHMGVLQRKPGRVSMKHIRGISASKAIRADALSDFYNAVWQAWLEFSYRKKNEIIVT